MSNCEELISRISEKDNVLGWMAVEMHSSATQEMWYPAITALFTLVEQTTKWATDSESEEKFFAVINLAKKLFLITEEEKGLLHQLRKTRNMYVHANFHSEILVLDNLLYPINDSGTAETLYEYYSVPVLQIILKLLGK